MEGLISILDVSMPSKNKVGVLCGRADQDSGVGHALIAVGQREHVDRRWRVHLTGGRLLGNSNNVSTQS